MEQTLDLLRELPLNKEADQKDYERMRTFQEDFCDYIQDTWIRFVPLLDNRCHPLLFYNSGSYNPEDWNLYGRSEDLTNNISEGLNSKIIKLLVSSHPHLNKLLYTLVGLMMEAEQKYLKVLVRYNRVYLIISFNS